MRRQTRLLMGMPVTLALAGGPAGLIDEVFGWFTAVDQRFSLYRTDSEISALNAGRLPRAEISRDMREVLEWADRTRRETDGYFDIRRADGTLDPSGIVKGWAVLKAARLIEAAGVEDYFVDGGGDIQTGGKNADGLDWAIGIRHPFEEDAIVKALNLAGRGIATSGNYARGDHIYNPHSYASKVDEIVSLSVIASDVLEADRFATAAFAMGRDGIGFIEDMPGLEGYAIEANGMATQSSGFGAFVVP
ncbi:MAG: FAD:protein FMN transferase [Hyphomicrobiales bacterium]|nr:FAD:protein FMN transferase [Hyphomicrobiales bacterium]